MYRDIGKIYYSIVVGISAAHLNPLYSQEKQLDGFPLCRLPLKYCCSLLIG